MLKQDLIEKITDEQPAVKVWELDNPLYYSAIYWSGGQSKNDTQWVPNLLNELTMDQLKQLLSELENINV